MCNPPREGDESFETFQNEKKNILKDLKQKANLVGSVLNQPEVREKERKKERIDASSIV